MIPCGSCQGRSVFRKAHSVDRGRHVDISKQLLSDELLHVERKKTSIYP